MGKVALILIAVATLAGFWTWSQEIQVKRMTVEKTPTVSGEYIRVKTVLDRDGGKLRFLIEPMGVSSVSLSAFSMEAILDRQGGKPVLNQELIGAGWSFPLALVDNQTLKLSGVYISPSSYMLSGEQEIAAVTIDNLGNDEVVVRMGEENTKFLKKDATGIKFRYE